MEPVNVTIVDAINMLRSLRQDRRGVTALEYGIMASILGLVLISIFKGFVPTMSGIFSRVGASL